MNLGQWAFLPYNALNWPQHNLESFGVNSKVNYVKRSVQERNQLDSGDKDVKNENGSGFRRRVGGGREARGCGRQAGCHRGP